MITSYKEDKIDVAIGLTEGFINGSATTPGLYKLIGTYVSSPLCWAISAGRESKTTDVSQLRGSRCGVSRIGSGSYVMSFVLADKMNWLARPSSPSADQSARPAPSSSTDTTQQQVTREGEAPFEFKVLDTFKGLREGVNSGTADFFMWEKFTTRRYASELANVGEIYTPWPSWVVTCSSRILDASRDRNFGGGGGIGGEEGGDGHDERASAVQGVLRAIDEGVRYFRDHHDESIALITNALDYTLHDAQEWRETVVYPDTVGKISHEMVDNTISTLRAAGLMQNDEGRTTAGTIIHHF